MPKRVAVWTWARELRDHGPRSQGFLLAMHTLRTWMNRDGEAFPSQSNWAKGCAQHVKTLRRHVKYAVEQGWLLKGSAGRGGQGWRHYYYSAAVPDSIVLEEMDQELSDGVEQRTLCAAEKLKTHLQRWRSAWGQRALERGGEHR